MGTNNKTGVPSEVKVTVDLLLDTEEKIEKLQAEIDSLGKGGGGPAYNLNPPGFATGARNETNAKKAHLQAQINDLKSRSIQIADQIENGATGETKQRIARLKEEWIKDMEPGRGDESKDVSHWQKGANRQLNKDWTAVDQPEQQQFPFEKNKDDIEGKKASYLDKARGLKEDYAYLEKDVSGPDKETSSPELDKSEPDGPDMDKD